MVWLSRHLKKILILLPIFTIRVFHIKKNTHYLASHQKMNLLTFWTCSPTRSDLARAEQGLLPLGMTYASQVSFHCSPSQHLGRVRVANYSHSSAQHPSPLHSFKLPACDIFVCDPGLIQFPLPTYEIKAQRRKTCLRSYVVLAAKRKLESRSPGSTFRFSP